MPDNNGRYAILNSGFPCSQSGYSTPPVVQSYHYSPMYAHTAYTTPCSQTNYYSSCGNYKNGSGLSRTDAYSNEDLHNRFNEVEGFSLQKNIIGRQNVNLQCNNNLNNNKETFKQMVLQNSYGCGANMNKEQNNVNLYQDNFDSCRKNVNSQVILPLTPRSMCKQCDGRCPNGYGCTKYQPAFMDCGTDCSEGMVGYASISKPVNFGGSYGSVPNNRNVSPGVRANCEGGCAISGCYRNFL